MEDYPRTMAELETRYTDEASCLAYLTQLRWPSGIRCPRCQGTKVWPVRRLFECAACGHQISVTADTIFHRSHLPLTTWFRAIWWVVTQKNGASAMGLHRVLGISYKTAWVLLHRLRRAMIRPGRECLDGCVEVDETYVGGLEEGVHGRETESKALVIIAAQEDGKGIGRIRMRRIPDASAKSLHPFVLENLAAGCVIHTDGWQGYAGLDAKGYRHEATPRRKASSETLPRVHRVASLLKRWILGTHQGAVSAIHLDYYLDEFTFRFNRRTSRDRGKLFYRLLQQAVTTAPASFDEISKHTKPFERRKHKI